MERAKMKLRVLVALAGGLVGACNQGIVGPQQQTPEASVPTGWSVIFAGTNNLNGVSGVSDNAVWVVGDRGTIGHWDGTQLVFETSGTQANLRGVWAVSPDEAYAVGDGGTILKRSAGAWTTVAKGLTRQILNSVWASSSQVIAVGSLGTIVVGNAMGYQLVPATVNDPATGKPTTLQENLFGVTGAGGGQVSAVGALGLVLDINGTTVTRTTIKNFTKLLSGVANGTGTTYLVGQQGTVYRADATGLNTVVGCPGTALRSVATVGADAWAVGWDGTICKIAGKSVTSYGYTDSRWFNGIYAASASSLWVVGASGTLIHGLPLAPVGDH